MSKETPKPPRKGTELTIYIGLAIVGVAARLPFIRNHGLVTYDGTYYLNEAKALFSAEKLPGAFPTGYPAAAALYPISVPRRVLDTVLPRTSFADTEHIPRARLNKASSPSTAHPAGAPVRVSATRAMANMATACSTLPAIHTPLRFGNCRI